MNEPIEEWDPADVVQALDEDGALDFEYDIEAIMELHEALTAAGINADSPETYRVMLAAGMLIAEMAAYDEDDPEDFWPDFAVATEVISKVAARCYRDLKNNGG